MSTPWSCPVCGFSSGRLAFRVPPGRAGTSDDGFRPSTQRYGETVSDVLRCQGCGHVSVREPPAEQALMQAYEGAADAVSVREEAGQVTTAARALEKIEGLIQPGRLLDLGCWTGSFMVAARQRGWIPVGVEPSEWARARARERGLDVLDGDLFAPPVADASFRLVVLCDVLEHVTDPVAALRRIAALLEPGGHLYLTVPNAGSAVARLLGRRWWSVLPMHLQYFTPVSLELALERGGFSVATRTSHAKTFTARYYAERLGGYSERVQRGLVGLLERVGQADRLVGPDFGDRLAVLAALDGAPEVR